MDRWTDSNIATLSWNHLSDIYWWAGGTTIRQATSSMQSHSHMQFATGEHNEKHCEFELMSGPKPPGQKSQDNSPHMVFCMISEHFTRVSVQSGMKVWKAWTPLSPPTGKMLNYIEILISLTYDLPISFTQVILVSNIGVLLCSMCGTDWLIDGRPFLSHVCIVQPGNRCRD